MTERLSEHVFDLGDGGVLCLHALHQARHARRVRVLADHRYGTASGDSLECACGPAQSVFDAAGDEGAGFGDDAVFELPPRRRAHFGQSGDAVLADAELFAAVADGVAEQVGVVPHPDSVTSRHVVVNRGIGILDVGRGRVTPHARPAAGFKSAGVHRNSRPGKCGTRGETRANGPVPGALTTQ